QPMQPWFLPGNSTKQPANGGDMQHFDSQSIVGLVVWMCCVLYSSLRSASKSDRFNMFEHALVGDNGGGRSHDVNLIGNEEGGSIAGGESEQRQPLTREANTGVGQRRKWRRLLVDILPSDVRSCNALCHDDAHQLYK
ncbi:uncharacterized protein LOC120355338, partial [Nilaparvata lugens]|uniref:uncharacterized protein LOC120355338 n=1 Tax=Nilaparvata lugens TaxID=108931 RepID=UPI00193D9B53